MNSRQSLIPRAPDNTTCPYNLKWPVINGVREHAACYAPYFTNVSSFNITHVLGACCNAHGNRTIELPIVQDTGPDADFGTTCLWGCNATWVEDMVGNKTDYGEAFWSLQDCVRRESKGHLDEYQIQCFPKIEIAESTCGRGMGVSKVVISLVVGLGILVGLA